jgi:tRNA (guanine-N7-)-methyltransferase
VVELVLESYFARLDLHKIFGRAAPLHVDLGCGDGSFLFALAERNLEKNFLGIERLAGRVGKARRQAAKTDNMRVLHLESSYAVRYLLPRCSVETFYLLFPDPWPKRRHHRRRIVTAEFLRSIHAALWENGLLRIATDQLDYFEQIVRLGRNDSQFAIVDVAEADLPPTKFERKFQGQGVPIYRLGLRKMSPVI